MNKDDFEIPTAMAVDEPRKGVPMVLKIAIGCFGVMVVMVVLGGVGAFMAYRFAMGKVNEFSKEFTDKGYASETRHIAELKQSPEKPTVYVAQFVKVTGQVDVDLAFAAQVVEIEGTVNGDIDFLGQVLVVKPKGVVTGDIRVKAGQVIQIDGRVDGKISGSYQVLQDKSRQSSTPKATTPSIETPATDTPEAPAQPEPPEPAKKSDPESDES